MHNEGIDTTASYGDLTGAEYLTNLLNDLNSTDTQTVYSALVALRVVLQKGSSGNIMKILKWYRLEYCGSICTNWWLDPNGLEILWI